MNKKEIISKAKQEDYIYKHQHKRCVDAIKARRQI
jgi:hypothetical protein